MSFGDTIVERTAIEKEIMTRQEWGRLRRDFWSK